MLFNSYIFVLLFLPLVLAGYYFLGKKLGSKAAQVFLIVASLVFYMWWNPIYIVLLLATVLFNYGTARLIKKHSDNLTRKRKVILFFGISINLLSLAYFKYANFFLENVSSFTSFEFPLLNIVLPLAISFFTLQQITFLVDVYEGLTEEKSLRNYLLYVCFFPQLIAGPIVHHRDLISQFQLSDSEKANAKNLSIGIFIFCVGLFKKVVIADSIAPMVEAVYEGQNSLNMIEAWLGTLGYTLQVYFDFSGYSDMAVGLGLMFNINLPLNFNSPYKATTIIQFWQRWHMTLTQFINAYLYMPLMRLKGSFSYSYSMVVTLIIMMVIGLWHGANWNYVLFGSLHGLALVVNHLWQLTRIRLPSPFAWLLTFIWWHLTLIVFRSDTVEKAERIVNGLLFGGIDTPHKSVLESLPYYYKWMPADLLALFSLAVLGGLLVCCVVLKNPHDHRDNFSPSYKYFIITLFCFLSSVLLMNRVIEFIYFQF